MHIKVSNLVIYIVFLYGNPTRKPKPYFFIDMLSNSRKSGKLSKFLVSSYQLTNVFYSTKPYSKAIPNIFLAILTDRFTFQIN